MFFDIIKFSRINQVDKLFIALNGYREVPDFISRDPFIEYVLLDNSLGDAAKFYDVEKRDGYFFSCDDDLIYPEKYCKNVIKLMGIWGDRNIITYHGRIFSKRPIQSYYRSATTKLRCLDDVDIGRFVDIGGTGTMCFHTDFFNLKLSDFKRPNMADIWVSKEANVQNVAIYVPPHSKDYIKYIPQTSTIWHDEHLDDSYQTAIVNEFLK